MTTMEILVGNPKGWSKVIALAVLMIAASATLPTGATDFVWTGGSGKWSVASNWKNGGVAATRAPGCDAGIADDVASFDLSADATVEVDCDVTLLKMTSVQKGGLEVFPVLKFEGGHKITMTASDNSATSRPRFNPGLDVRFGEVEIDTVFLDILGIGRFEDESSIVVRNTLYIFAAGAQACFEDGCQVQAAAIDARSAGSFIFNGGRITGLGGTVGYLGLNSAGSSATVNNGYVKMRPVATSGSSFFMRGGMVDAAEGNASPSFAADATFEFTGGTIRTRFDIPADDLRYFAGKGTVLDCLSQNSTAISSFSSAERTVDFGGTLYLTNSTSARWNFATNSVVTGRGRLYGGSVWMTDKCTVDWDLDTLALAGQFYQSTLTSCTFGDDLTLRPYGSSWQASNYTSTFALGGKIKVDTLDCADNTTPRTITLPRAQPRPGTSLEVTGGGVLEWKQCDVVRPIGDVVVRVGSTLRLFGPLSAASLTLEANAAVEMRADGASVSAAQPPYIEARTFSIAPTATISYTLPASPADAAYPLISRSDGGDVSSVASGIVLNGNGSGTYAIHTAGSVAFLWNGVNPTSTFTPGNNQYLWTGESTTDDKWTTDENWYGNSEPGDSAYYQIFIGGMARQTLNWDRYSSYRTSRWKFLPTCGPMTISGGPVNTIAYSGYDTNPNFISESRFPVIFKNGLASPGRISISSSNSYVTVLGSVTPVSSLYVGGDVRFGGQSTIAGELNFFEGMSGGRETRLEILPGGSITVNANTSLYTIRSSIVVDGNGKLTYEAGEGNVYGWNAKSWIAERVHAIDGEMSVMCPLTGGRVQRYRGTGSLHVETTRSHADGNCEVNLGGGIAFTSGDFRTVTADSPNHSVRIAVAGDATLRAGKPWTYGPEAGVATTTTVDDRALAVLANATLTIDTPDNAITLADPIRGKGKLRFAAGAKLVLDGRLPKYGRWTEIATVGEIEGTPQVDRRLYMECFRNPDGTVSLMAKPMVALSISIR